MELYYHGLSDTGNFRSNNEDYVFAGKLRNDEYLFIVADGMGGHQAGEVASRKSVTMFVRRLEKERNIQKSENSGYLHETFKQIIMEINETLIREGNRSHKKTGMGTTFSALYVIQNRGYIIHVGDSRIYRFSPLNAAAGGMDAPDTPVETDRFTRLTEDHSFVGKLVKDGLISEEEARNHPKRNVLFQSIGIKRDITIQTVGPIPIQRGQKYLVCSDGLYGVVPDHELETYLEEKSTVQIAEGLVKRANFNGGPDNISVIIISTEADEKANLPDTVKITAFSPLKRKHNRFWIFTLLGLLLLLLAIIVYLLAMGASSQPISRAHTQEGVTGTVISPGTETRALSAEEPVEEPAGEPVEEPEDG